MFTPEFKRIHSELSKRAANGEFASPPDQAALYSGPGQRDRAMASGRFTIDRTAGGQWLSSLDLYHRSALGPGEADLLWKRASVEYARSAKGQIVTFVVGALQRRVFRQVELGHVLKNEKVESINGMSRTELVKVFHEAKKKVGVQAALDAAYQKVLANEYKRWCDAMRKLL